jgi:hypothetical protein
MKTILPALFLSCILFTRSAMAGVPLYNSYPSANAVIFLDFDGHTVTGTSWNFTGSIVCGGAGLDSSQVTAVFNRVAEDYRPFNINITTDSVIFLRAPMNSRMRVIVTVTSEWYGQSGGVSFINSFTWGDDTPCFVFSALLGFDTKYIGEASSHEAGHTLGLYHQSKYDSNCVKLSEYNYGSGTGEIGWAPIMGAGYYQNLTLWNNGPNSYGCNSSQSDLDIITGINGFSYRPDDHQEKFNRATNIPLTGNQFTISGVIEQRTDKDVFKFNLPARKRFRLSVVPYNIGTGNNGADIDLSVSLFGNSEKKLLAINNPGIVLNCFIDTILNAGTYYLRIEGSGNIYASNYASLGSYSLQGLLEPDTSFIPARPFLEGHLLDATHRLSWDRNAITAVETETLEVAPDGSDFNPVSPVFYQDRHLLYKPVAGSVFRYRLKVVYTDGHTSYSNIVSLTPQKNVRGPRLRTNLISTNMLTVIADGVYNYYISDLSGRMVGQGILSGDSRISIPGISDAGMYIIRFMNDKGSWDEKFIRQ